MGLVSSLKTPGCRSECGMTAGGHSLRFQGGRVGADIIRQQRDAGLLWDAAWNGSARRGDFGALHFDGVYEYAKKM